MLTKNELQFKMPAKLRLLIVGFFVLFLSSCATKLADNSSSLTGLPDLEAQRLAELFRIKAAFGDKVWSGFGSHLARLVLVGSEHQWLINGEQVPVYYIPIELPTALAAQMKSLYVTPAFRDELGHLHAEAPKILFNAYSKEQTRGHFRHSIFFIKTIGEYHRAGDWMTSDEWIHVALHELFHTFQDDLMDYTEKELLALATPLKKNLVDDADHRALVLKELRLLGEAVCIKSSKKSVQSLDDALTLRRERWRWIQEKYKQSPEFWERYEVWAEGTARYVEKKLMTLYEHYSKDTLLQGDPEFRGYKSYADSNSTTWCKEIMAGERKTYWHLLGFGYALALDRHDPNWKKKPVKSPLFLDSLLEKIVGKVRVQNTKMKR